MTVSPVWCVLLGMTRSCVLSVCCGAGVKPYRDIEGGNVGCGQTLGEQGMEWCKGTGGAPLLGGVCVAPWAVAPMVCCECVDGNGCYAGLWV